MPVQNNRIHPVLWRLLVVCSALVLIAIIAGIVLLALGAADVKPVGDVLWEQSAIDGACLPVSSLELPALLIPATLELTADIPDREDDLARWGIWVGDPTNPAQRWEVMPPGYYRYDGQTHGFHHITDRDTLRLDLTPDGFLLWLNREKAMSGPFEGSTARWGLLGSDDDRICWRRIAVYGTN